MKLESKNRVYKLTGNRTPLSCIIPSRNSKSTPLLYFDEDKGYNRALRYARNAQSPFEDEQKGQVILEPIIFDNGMLSVPKNNPVLQQFLHYHPLNGKKFVEVNLESDASAQVDMIQKEVDALIEVSNMSVEQLEQIGRVILTRDVNLMSTSEMKRDILVFARRNPSAFLSAISNPLVKLMSTVQKFFDDKVLAFRNKGKEVYFNLDGNKKRMAVIPYGVDPIEYIAEWFQTDDGVEVLKFLEKAK